MKKILLFLCLFLITSNVKAETYYSDYTLAKDWNTDFVSEDNLTLVKEEKRYKWYSEKKVYGGYEESLDYPLIDYNDYIELEGECSLDYSDNKKEKVVYYYKELRPSRYISFENLSGSNGSLRISEIKVMDGAYEIPYSVIECNGCNATFSDYIHNGNYKENMSSVTNGGSFKLDLGTYHYLNDLIIYLGVYDSGGSEEIMTIKILDDSDVNYIYNWRTDYGFQGTQDIELSYLDKIVFSPVILNYTDEIKTTEKPEAIVNRVIREEKQYCEVIKKYRHYKIEKIYSSDYMKDGTSNYPLCDYDDVKTYYQVYKRDYLTIQDDIEITSLETRLESFIDSNIDFTISSDVDLGVNGLYQFIVDSPVKKVIANVKVNILENSIREVLDSLLDNLISLEKQKDNIVLTDLNKQELNDVLILIKDMQDKLLVLEEDFKDQKELVIDNDILKKEIESYLERVDSLKKSLLLLERVAKSFYETILKQEEESLSKDKQIEATNKKIKDLLLEMESLKHLNQFLENDNNLLNASKSDMQASYLEEIDSLNNLLQNKKCDSDIDVTKSSVLELDSLYYLGFGFIIVGLILSIIVVIKKNN